MWGGETTAEDPNNFRRNCIQNKLVFIIRRFRHSDTIIRRSWEITSDCVDCVHARKMHVITSVACLPLYHFTTLPRYEIQIFSKIFSKTLAKNFAKTFAKILVNDCMLFA